MLVAVADRDLQIRRGGGHPDPEMRVGPVLKKIYFRPFGPHFRLKIRGGLRVPPLDPPLPRSNLPVSFSVSIILKQT